MDSFTGRRPSVSEVALPQWERRLLAAGGAVVGAGVLGVLPLVADRLAALPAIPARDVLTWLATVADDRSWVPALMALVGLVAGLALGVWAAGRASRVRVTARDVLVAADGEVRRIARSQVAEAVCEGRVLVLRDAADVDVLRQKLDVAPGRVRAALRAHGWPVGTDEVGAWPR